MYSCPGCMQKLHKIRSYRVFLLQESESVVAFRWVYREFNLMFTLSSDKDQRKNCFRSMEMNLFNNPRLIDFIQTHELYNVL